MRQKQNKSTLFKKGKERKRKKMGKERREGKKEKRKKGTRKDSCVRQDPCGSFAETMRQKQNKST